MIMVTVSFVESTDLKMLYHVERTKIRNGGLEAEFKTFPGGKSEDDIALGILRSSSQPDIVELRQILIRYFSVVVGIIDNILRPSADKQHKDFHDGVVSEIEATADYLIWIQDHCRRSSKDRDRLGGFAERSMEFFNNQVCKYLSLLLTTTPEKLVSILQSGSGPTIFEETIRLQEALSWFSECLENVPDENGGFTSGYDT